MLSFGTQQVTQNQQTTQNSSPEVDLDSSLEEGKLSFSQLLKGVTAQSSEEKTLLTQQTDLTQTTTLQNPSFQEEKTKKEGLLSLLQMSTEPSDEPVLSTDTQPLTLNTQVTQKLSISELKQLIFDAKEFLKEQIKQTDGYKQAQIKELPKSLKGLTQLAQKLGLDLSQISIEEVGFTDEKEPSKLTNQTTIKKEKVQQPLQQKMVLNDNDVEELQKPIISKTTSTTKPQTTPLFQERSTQQVQIYSTQQLVQTKQQKNEPKISKSSSQTTLQQLLHGEGTKSSESSVTLNVTKEFSKESAPVIAPKASTELTKNLESLLHQKEEGTNSSSEIKTNTITPPKADALEVKMNEAKQMVRYLSSDVKSAIEDYKSPFTKVKLQLNPQELGKVDLTIVQRGNNLHVNISSNNAAIQTLALNANDLKTQLQNNGINNATLNFNNGTESDSSQSQQNHQQQRHQQKASSEYNYFDDELTNEELYDSLEIIVPYYA